MAVVLLFRVARHPGYIAGWMMLVWAVGEGFGGPYMSGATAIRTGIVYHLPSIARPPLSATPGTRRHG